MFIFFVVPGKPGAPMAKPFDDTAINITFQRPTYGGLPSTFEVYYRPRGWFVYISFVSRFYWTTLTHADIFLYM